MGDGRMRTALDYASAYVRQGFAVIPVPYKTKRPNLEGWQQLRLTEDELARHFSGNVNLGILCGEPSGWLVDVDCDAWEAMALAPELLAPSRMVHGHGDETKARSKPRSHYWFRSQGVATKKYQFPGMNAAGARPPKLTMIVELRSTGCQTIVPPSVHTSGETLYWDNLWGPDELSSQFDRLSPAEIASADLERAVAKLAAAALLAQHWPGTGSRDDAAMALCGMLVRAGWSDEEIDHFAQVTAQAGGDEQWRQRGKARHSREQLAAGKRVTGAPKLADLLVDGEQVVSKVREWLGLNQPPEQPKAPPPVYDAPPTSRDTLGPEGRLSSEIGVLLSEVEAEAVQGLWGNRLYVGKLVLLDGDPGLGKTMIAGDLAARFTIGATMPDDSPGIEGGAGVVIFTAEDGAGDTLQPRIKAAAGNLSRVLVVTTIPVHDAECGDVIGERFPTFLDLDVIEQAINRVSAKLVIFDPFMSYLPPTVNSFRDQEVRTALAPVARLAAKTGAIFFLIRHLNKSQSANPLYRGGGTIGIIGAARSALLVARDPNDETKCVLASTKNNLAALPPSLSYSVGASADGVPVITWHGESEHTARMLLAEPENADDRSATDDAVNWLSGELADGPAKAEDIERKARGRFSDKALRRARKRLGIKPKKQGFGGNGYWEWSLPPKPPEPPKAPSQDKGAPLTGRGILGTEGHLSNGHKPGRLCYVCKTGWLAPRPDGGYFPCPVCAAAAAQLAGNTEEKARENDAF
jgi:hypothetical protein